MKITNTDIREHGRGPDGETVHSDRRLYLQLQVFTGCREHGPILEVLEKANIEATLYQDACDPTGIAIAAVSEDPEFFIGAWRDLLLDFQFEYLQRDPDYTMFGRSYSLGYEEDLDEVLLYRTRRRLADPELNWTVWYPLRRSGEFEMLDEREQREALMEHGRIGFAFGEAGHARDIRLACHGMDRNDNDFVIGLLGRDLHPLSAIVQTMRGTVQTSQYIDSLGPFFVGRKIWTSPALSRNLA